MASLTGLGTLQTTTLFGAKQAREHSVAEPILQKARLIPVSGIGSAAEAEQRATSALLAVMSVVRDLSIELLSPLGASRAQKAAVEAFIEVSFPGAKKRVRPDGLVRVSYGTSSWSTFVEVKTGTNALTADQVNSYWDLAREHAVDHVLTISNEIAPREGIHPTDGLKVRTTSKVGVSHLSWTAIVSAAVRIKRHKGVDDPEQAWLLDELIRYLQHPKSGALDFSDMGQHWVAIRDGAREGSLSRRSEGLDDVVARWDQLIRYAALNLSAEIGEDVDPVLPRSQRDPRHRTAALVDSIVTDGSLTGALRIPNTASDMQVEVNLRARQITASLDVGAPFDKGTKGRISWLVNQISDAPRDLMLEAYAKNARSHTSATLGAVLEDRYAVLDADRREPHRFRVVMRAEMGMSRKSGARSPGFIDAFLKLLNTFYGEVVQNISAWHPPAPKLTRAERTSEDEASPAELWPWPADEDTGSRA